MSDEEITGLIDQQELAIPVMSPSVVGKLSPSNDDHLSSNGTADTDTEDEDHCNMNPTRPLTNIVPSSPLDAEKAKVNGHVSHSEDETESGFNETSPTQKSPNACDSPSSTQEIECDSIDALKG